MNIHFIGIGGVSMSALAKYLHSQKFNVTGSDKVQTNITNELNNIGIKVFIGHSPSNLQNAEVVIFNSAITNDNIELKIAKERGICLIDRATLINYISKPFNTKIGVCGCHGKTTVTSIIAHILKAQNLKFMAHIGGFDNDFGNFIYTGKDIFLSEICEFNKNIDKFTPHIGVCLNIDNDHMNCYNDFNDLVKTYYNYLDRADLRIINIEDKFLSAYKNSAVTYGIDKGDFHIQNLRKENESQIFDVIGYGKKMFELSTFFKGEYSILNILSAISTAQNLGILSECILEGINSFTGVKRRNELIGTLNGAKVICDYCHHPTEISAFLNEYRADCKNVYIVFQPHTYSRTKILFKEFSSIFDGFENLYFFKTYAARENFDYLGSSLRLSLNYKNSLYFDQITALIDHLKSKVDSKSKILVLGAGDLYEGFKNYLNNNI